MDRLLLHRRLSFWFDDGRPAAGIDPDEIPAHGRTAFIRAG